MITFHKKKMLLAGGLAGAVLSAYCTATADYQAAAIRDHSSGIIGEYFKIKHTPFTLDEIVIQNCHDLYNLARGKRLNWGNRGVPVPVISEFEKPIGDECRKLSAFRGKIHSKIKELKADPEVAAAIRRYDGLTLEGIGYFMTTMLSVVLLYAIGEYYPWYDKKNSSKPL